MKARNLVINISKQTVQNRKYFVYQDKKYPINFDLLKQNCTYFYKNQNIYLEEDNINLIEDDQEVFPLTEESIKSFIAICQNEISEISLSSVIPLQYLSYKYEYPALKKITDEFVMKYSNELLFEKLLFNNNKSDKNIDKDNEKEEPFFDTSREEEYLSNHLKDFIKAEELTKLKVPVLDRILEKYYKNENKDNKVSLKDMNDFLFRCLDKHGREASILFNKIDFGEEQVNMVHRLFHEYQDKFDFNLLNSTLAKTTLQLTNELNRQKEKYSELFSEMKKTFEMQKEELTKMKEEQKRKEIEHEKEDKERKEKYAKEIDDIKKDAEQRMLNIEKKYQKMCESQKK